MKPNIACLLILFLLSMNILPIGAINGNEKIENENDATIPLSFPQYLKIEGIDGESKLSAGVKITIINNGDQTLRDIEWTFDAEGGTIVFGDGIKGRIPLLEKGEETAIILRPIPLIFRDANGQSPIGIGDITLMATAKTTTHTLEATEDAYLIGPIIIFI